MISILKFLVKTVFGTLRSYLDTYDPYYYETPYSKGTTYHDGTMKNDQPIYSINKLDCNYQILSTNNESTQDFFHNCLLGVTQYDLDMIPSTEL